MGLFDGILGNASKVGTFDLDAELKIWISGTATPIQKQFNKKLSIYEVQAVLAAYVMR